MNDAVNEAVRHVVSNDSRDPSYRNFEGVSVLVEVRERLNSYVNRVAGCNNFFEAVYNDWLGANPDG